MICRWTSPSKPGFTKPNPQSGESLNPTNQGSDNLQISLGYLLSSNLSPQHPVNPKILPILIQTNSQQIHPAKVKIALQ
jgi:hypothetical protein